MARRVNTKFLIIFSVIVLGGVAGLTLLAGPFKNLLYPDRGRKLIEVGDRLVKEADSAETTAVRKEKLESAVANYRNAANTETKNPGLYVKLGDTFSKLSQFDVASYIKLSRDYWEKALEIDPRYLPALRRLQDSYYKEATIRLGASAFTFGKLREKAAAIHAIEPGDVRAHALMWIAPLNQWVLDIETPGTDVNAAIAELTTLIEQSPSAPELPDMVFFVASAKAKQAIDMKRGGNDAQGNDLLKVARQNFQDAIKVQEQNGNMHYRCFQLEA